MSLLEFQFNITEVINCPIYKKGDFFELSGVVVTPPHKRTVCVFPIKVLANFLKDIEGKASDSYNKEVIGKEFNCGGCTGLIKFICANKEEGWSLPQFRLEKEYERKKEMAEKESQFGGLLKDFSLLNGFDENSLKDFISCATMKKFPTDHTLLRVDTPGKHLLLILEGKVALFNKAGETINHLGKGEIIGEMSLMFDSLINVTVKAIEPIKVLVVEGEDFKQLLIKYPFIKMELARMIAKRLSKANVPLSQRQSPGISGRLTELPSPELFQMIHENMKSGTAELTLPEGPAVVEFAEGEIINSEYNGQTGKDAFYSIIMEQEGLFTFDNIPQTTSAKSTPVGGFMSMLMEGLRLLDEKKSQPSEQHATAMSVE